MSFQLRGLSSVAAVAAGSAAIDGDTITVTGTADRRS